MLAAEVRPAVHPPAVHRDRACADFAGEFGKACQLFGRVAACREDNGSAREIATAGAEGLVGHAPVDPFAQGEGDEARLPAVGPRHGNGEGAAAFGLGGNRRVGGQRVAACSAAAQRHIDAGHRAHRPCGHIVKLVRQIDRAPAFLFGEEIGRQRRVAVEETADQPRGGLGLRHGEVACRIGLAADSGAAFAAQHGDALRGQTTTEALCIPAPLAEVDHIGALARRACGIPGAVGGEIGQEPLRIVGHGGSGGYAGGEVVGDRVSIGQLGPVAPLPYQPAR